jgi:hypothetical protein|tara:strand:- start:178 stop:279 length:102 start_codon:yes stop_codon:yes gene_type:complete
MRYKPKKNNIEKLKTFLEKKNNKKIINKNGKSI